MKRYSIVLVLLLVLVLSGCKSDKNEYNFRPRQNDTYISNDGTVLISYKTDENGRLERIYIDRLLTIEQMITKNPFIDYDVTVPGFEGEIFVSAPPSCLLQSGVKIPVNIEVGSIRYKFKTTDCIYKEVGRDNEFKTTSFAKEYGVKDTIEEPIETSISIVVYMENSTSKLFTEVYDLHHTLRTIGVYGIPLSVDNGLPRSNAVDFTKHMKIYEQYLLKMQENELAVNEIYGYSSDINLLSIEEIGSVSALIDNFTDLYENEYEAMKELQEEIGIFPVEEVEEDEPIDETEDETTYRMWKYEY